MGIVKKAVKGVGKVVKKVAGGVKKVVKKVASGVKKVAKGVVKGVTKVADKVTGGAFGKIMGKLGPIGTIGMSLLLPGAGAFLGGLWKAGAAAASGYAGIGSTFINGVGTAMNLATKAVGVVSKGVRTVTGGITDKIKAGFEYVGGKVSDGANYIFKGAQEFAGVKDPSSISDAGSWVVDKAKSMNPFKGQEALPAQEGMFSSVETGAGVQNVAMSPVSAEQMGNYDMVTPMFDPKTGEAMGNAMASPSSWSAEQAKMFDPSSINTSLGAIDTGTGTIAGGQSSIAGNTYMSPGGVTQGSLTAPPPGINVSGVEASSRAKDSFLDKIIDAGGNMLTSMSTQPQQMGMMPQPYYAGGASVGDDFASQRFGVGGQGSSGGDFLSEQQRYQQQLLAQQLSQLG